MANRADRFEVVYQQQDADPASVLGPKRPGSTGATGRPAAWTSDRDRLELPKGPDGRYTLNGDLVSVMTVDPSPTKFWAIQWWVYQPSTEFRWLMDLRPHPDGGRRVLGLQLRPPEAFTGCWRSGSRPAVTLQLPITHVIVEDNAAQRFLLQYDHVRRWMALDCSRDRAPLTPTETSPIPSSAWSRYVSTTSSAVSVSRTSGTSDGFNMLHESSSTEVTTYPHGRTDDCVMAHWFLEWNLPRIYSPQEAEGRIAGMPTWASSVPDLRGQARCRIRAVRHAMSRSDAVIDPEQIVSLYTTRRMKRQPMMDKRLKVLEQYNGDTKVDLPELDSTREAGCGQSPGPGSGPVRPADRLHSARHRLPVPAPWHPEMGRHGPPVPAGQPRLVEDEPDGPAGIQAGPVPAGLRLGPGNHPPGLGQRGRQAQDPLLARALPSEHFPR